MNETVTCCREWAVYVDNAGTTMLVHADSEVGEERIKLPPGEHAHCRKCGARFTLLADGTVDVGPSQDRLLAGYRRAVEDLHNSWPQDECPMDFNHDCQFPADACCDVWYCRRAARHEGRCCWLGKWGLATTYVDAQTLWARMEDAAK